MLYETKKPSRGCNLCDAHMRASKKGLLKESFDCLCCGTSYKPSKKRVSNETKAELSNQWGE